MDKLTNGIESPQKEAAISSLKQTTGFAEALALATSESVTDNEDTFLPLEDYGRSVFNPNMDENRDVVVYGPNGKGDNIIPVKRTGSGESQGVYVSREQIEISFDIEFASLEKRTQINLVMANGKILIGYVVKGKSRNGVYFSKKYAEPVLTLPPQGKQLPIKTLSIIVG